MVAGAFASVRDTGRIAGVLGVLRVHGMDDGSDWQTQNFGAPAVKNRTSAPEHSVLASLHDGSMQCCPGWQAKNSARTADEPCKDCRGNPVFGDGTY